MLNFLTKISLQNTQLIQANWNSTFFKHMLF